MSLTTKTYLRISAIVSLIFMLGHSMGGLQSWSPMGENAVLQTMRATHFQLYGVSRGYYDFFMGFGWNLSLNMGLQTLLLWQLAGLTDTLGAKIKPMIMAFILNTLACAVVAWFFIFPIPVFFALLLLAPLIGAYIKAH
jgi:hypothetical protein